MPLPTPEKTPAKTCRNTNQGRSVSTGPPPPEAPEENSQAGGKPGAEIGTCIFPIDRSSSKDHCRTENPSRNPPAPAEGAMLMQTQGIVKIYDGRTVVKGVDINVRPGEIVGLLGPNGAGKNDQLLHDRRTRSS